jgi:hypothetical protein
VQERGKNEYQVAQRYCLVPDRLDLGQFNHVSDADGWGGWEWGGTSPSTKETSVSPDEVSTEQPPGEEENLEPIVDTWKQVVFHGLTDRKNVLLVSGDEFGDYHYFSTATSGGPLQPAEIWRTKDGLDWERVGEPGMGKSDNHGLIIYNWQDHL